MLCHFLIFHEFHSKTSDYYTCIIIFLYIYYNKKSIAVLFLRLSLRCMVLWVICVLIAFLPLDYPTQKRKSYAKSLATIGDALHSLLGFLFAVSNKYTNHTISTKLK